MHIENLIFGVKRLNQGSGCEERLARGRSPCVPQASSSESGEMKAVEIY